MGGSTDLSGGGRGGGVPPPEMERVGYWNPVEGCAPRHWREQENRARSTELGGRGNRGWENGGGRQDEELALKLVSPHLGTNRTRIVWICSKAQGGLKLYVIFSYTRDPPAVQMVSITGGKKRLCWYA